MEPTAAGASVGALPRMKKIRRRKKERNKKYMISEGVYPLTVGRRLGVSASRGPAVPTFCFFIPAGAFRTAMRFFPRLLPWAVGEGTLAWLGSSSVA